jgi:hypothetical protein
LMMVVLNSHSHSLQDCKGHLFYSNLALAVIDFKVTCSLFIRCEDVLVKFCFEWRFSLRNAATSLDRTSLFDFFAFLECNSRLSDGKHLFMLHVIVRFHAVECRLHVVLDLDLSMFPRLAFPYEAWRKLSW